jgi:hypothetical protein
MMTQRAKMPMAGDLSCHRPPGAASQTSGRAIFDLPRSTGRQEHLMSADPDRALLATSLAFAGAAVLGSAVAIREDLPGQPCGISIPLPVSTGLLVGWGAGVAAPWPMPAAAVIAAVRSQRTQPRALTGAVCAGIGIGCVLGTAIEPVTRRPRSWSAATRLAIAVNIAASAALTVTGLRHRAAAKALRLRNQAGQQHLTATSALSPPSPAGLAGEV